KGQYLFIYLDGFRVLALKGKDRTNGQVNFNVGWMKTLGFFKQVERFVVLFQVRKYLRFYRDQFGGKWILLHRLVDGGKSLLEFAGFKVVINDCLEGIDIKETT